MCSIMKLKLSAHNKPQDIYLPILIFNGSDLIPDVQEKEEKNQVLIKIQPLTINGKLVIW